jgi:hypothetical protein
MIVGLHGVFDRYPWIDRASSEYDLDEDAFSLVVKRAAAYGWSSTYVGGGWELEGQRWGHNDAGGDWTQDGRVRQVAWLQAAAAERLRGQRLPVLPAVTVLGDAVRRVGVLSLTGLHTLAPLHLATDSRADLVGAADWFALADPDGVAELTVTVSARETAALAVRASEIRQLALERTSGRMTVQAAPPGRAGLALPLAGEVQTSGMRQAMTFRCGAREWSLDVAAWATEVFVDALRATGTTEPVLVTVSAPPRPDLPPRVTAPPGDPLFPAGSSGRPGTRM